MPGLYARPMPNEAAVFYECLFMRTNIWIICETHAQRSYGILWIFVSTNQHLDYMRDPCLMEMRPLVNVCFCGPTSELYARSMPNKTAVSYQCLLPQTNAQIICETHAQWSYSLLWMFVFTDQRWDYMRNPCPMELRSLMNVYFHGPTPGFICDYAQRSYGILWMFGHPSFGRLGNSYNILYALAFLTSGDYRPQCGFRQARSQGEFC